MSRHLVRQDEEFQVVVGWDPPLQTFYAIVLDLRVEDEDDDKRFVFWEGTKPGEYENPWDLKEKILPWVTLSHEQLVELRYDQMENRA